ncbi:hypothetical protein PAAG_12364 [Paracoccidioides lutzii Pb01]|uniref:Zn(2)-C6 fungal-type domain-containing protein n=1 Tax=Paracoccidioides lutzii (strain ATCC MYA-826 / Pb01) TaxID=502779 RepID=A0A0A2V3H7_PARBA|nr:hypothetical protein PAAG_12364 [Paracoccidioides lutzii Pb01]KGQ00937.1 hypothetical protein PAAG_12364 [Paracoccidioides lutzii Pb01]
MSLPFNASATGSPLPSLTASVSDLPQAQVDAIIRTKRKAREPKACYPCHTRKVKCDRNLPCSGCVKRDHADLCSYERPSKKRQISAQAYVAAAAAAATATSSGGGDVGSLQVSTTELPLGQAGASGKVSIPKEEWDNVCAKLKDMENMITSLRAGLEQVDSGQVVPSTIPSATTTGRSGDSFPEREGIHASNELGNGTVHLGSRSVLAYLLGRSGTSQEASQALLEGGILPKLGLDNETATYPFVDLWSTDISTFDIRAVCAVLPDDEQCRMFIRRYRDIGATIYPVIPDIEQFEAYVDTLLQNRAIWGDLHSDSGEETERPYGMTLAFIGLLFAALAAGCQSSDLPSKERELTSQVYVCCSYQFLRMTNFLSQPTLEAIQTLLIIGNVLSYNMNPGVSYVLLGMTLRMGLALGLHVEANRFSANERYIRRRVWWSMAWQDSHFSLSYDRPSTMAFSQPDIPYHANSQPGNRSYFETLSLMTSLTLEILRARMLSPHSQMSVSVIQAYRDELQRIMADNYTPSAPKHRDHGSASQRAISSAFLLAVIGESKNDPHILQLLRRLETVIAERASSEGAFTAPAATTSTTTTAASTTNPSSSDMTSPHQSFGAPKLEHSEIIKGTTNISTPCFDPVSIASTAPVPVSVPVHTQTQWAKPLTKSLRALQKLNAVFCIQNKQNASQGHGGAGALPTPSSASTPNVGQGGFPQSSAGMNLVATKTESLPPHTPESTTSGEWTLPNLMDRAAEYIHPPLWA